MQLDYTRIMSLVVLAVAAYVLYKGVKEAT